MNKYMESSKMYRGRICKISEPHNLYSFGNIRVIISTMRWAKHVEDLIEIRKCIKKIFVGRSGNLEDLGIVGKMIY
jgi:hypothetical protein